MIRSVQLTRLGDALEAAARDELAAAPGWRRRLRSRRVVVAIFAAAFVLPAAGPRWAADR
jgi:hypothetical protein